MTSFLTYWYQKILPQIIPPCSGEILCLWQASESGFEVGWHDSVYICKKPDALPVSVQRVVFYDFNTERVRGEFFFGAVAQASPITRRQQLYQLTRMIRDYAGACVDMPGRALSVAA